MCLHLAPKHITLPPMAQTHPLRSLFHERAPSFLRNPLVERLFGIAQTIEFLDSLPTEAITFRDVIERLSDRVSLRIEDEGAEHIPSEGPLVVAANHPYPNLDYYCLAHIVERVRGPGSVRVVVDHLSKAMVPLRPLLAFIGETEAERSDFWSTQSEFLKRGGAIVIFPAGQTNFRGAGGVPVEPPWRGGALKLAKLGEAQLVPAYIRAHTSAPYNALRRLFPRRIVQNLNLREAHTRDVAVRIQFGPPRGEMASPDALRDAVYAAGEARFVRA